jgi:class 3 adenylate cyclase
MVALTPPGGLVTFLFTDIEGSTAMSESHPRPMAWALDRHDDVLSGVIASHAGHVFSRAGDAFAAAYEDPASAAGAALQAQHLLAAEEWPEPIVIRVRMGMHTETDRSEAATTSGRHSTGRRIAATARGGQIMVSAATAELIRRHLPSPAHLAEVGEFRLRGLVDAERVFQLNDAELESLFTTLPPADAYLLKHIVRDWPDTDAIRLLRNSARSLNPDGKVLIVDWIIPEGGEMAPAKFADLVVMALLPGGRDRTEAEFQTLLTASNLQLDHVTPL